MTHPRKRRRSWSDSLPLTFRTLAIREGHPLPDALPRDWPLEEWFADVCDTPLANLSHFDLARSCRQQVYLDEIVPFCLKVLADEPLAGELYDGEMVTALIGLPSTFWASHPHELRDALAAVRAAMDQTGDKKLRREVTAFRSIYDRGPEEL